MKILKIFTLITAFIFSSIVLADVYVNGYTRQNEEYVRSHYRSDPNGTVNDNWSTKGNVNPYTGQRGYNTYP